ncbi:hypothetical protein LCGC14_1495930 [marine sediment metagenome]|uniref:Uncharacterized protein n=1 Tax=marine sediment metagenome TaxID=412755 RepID=A0A0F9J617_9ZZZZ
MSNPRDTRGGTSQAPTGRKTREDVCFRGRVPSIATLEHWQEDGGCKATDGCWVEPDGTCEHGAESWLLRLGYI